MRFWIYPDRDGRSWDYPEEGLDGARVFYTEDRNSLPWHGRAWFVSEDKAVDLRRSRSVYHWEFLEYSNYMNGEGKMLDDIGLLDGIGTAKRDLGYRIVETKID